MSSDVVIEVENLGKMYRIGRDRARERDCADYRPQTVDLLERIHA
jgi:hypothetical protein